MVDLWKSTVRIIVITLLLAPAVFAQQGSEDNPEKVKLGLYITNLYDIDFAKNQYTVQFWTWFHHNNAGYSPNSTTEIMNAKTFKRNTPNEEVVEGIRWDTANIKATINQQWKVEDFPFDIQTFKIVFEDVNLTAEDLQFVPDIEASKIDPAAIPDGWEVEDFRLESVVNSYATAFGDPSATSDTKQNFSRMTVSIDLKRQGWRLFSTTFIGFFVATMLLLIVFVITSSHRAVAVIPQQPRITLCVGALFSAVGSIYGLSAKLPYTTEFTLADSLQVSTFAGVAFATIGSVASDVLMKNGKEDLAATINRFMFFMFILLSFGLNGLMIIRAIS